jgi:sugar phosphate isomerase/epimerase
MYPAVFGKAYPGTVVSDVLGAVAADGFCGVQFNLACAGLASLPEDLPDGLAEEVGRHARQKQLQIAALSGTYNMAHPDASVRDGSRRGFANVIEAARRMGSPVVTLCSGSRDASNMWKHHPENRSPAAWKDLRHELDFALELAEESEIQLGIEPEPGNIICDATAAKRLLKEVASPHLGIVLDAANLLTVQSLAQQDDVMEEAIWLLGEKLLLAHAKDMASDGRVVPAGAGAVHLRVFVKLLRSSGFDGALIGHGFGPEEGRAVSTVLAGLIQTSAQPGRAAKSIPQMPSERRRRGSGEA